MSEKPITNNSKVSTEPYKGVRDFYPEEMAIQNYIFDTWRKVAKESGYVEYGASILEPAELYKAKGERNEEIVNEQMYTFIDKGDREVALRPEMTPTLARMVAARRKGLKLPLRWFSIPNCFRYERSQRGRRREHWQLNCDLMGVTKDFSSVDADVEIIELAYRIMLQFGATENDFVFFVNDRNLVNEVLEKVGNLSDSTKRAVVHLLDSKDKIDNFESKLEHELGEEKKSLFLELLEKTKVSSDLNLLVAKLNERGVTNVKINTNIVRGFDYYTGIVFEVFDTNPENKRALFGGGRYDNLLEMFGVEPLPTVGFGMGDVTMRDFLETHDLLTKDLK